MSFTNNMYDRTETMQNLQESRGPGMYQIGMPKMCNSCFQPNPEVRLQKNGVSIEDPTQERFYAGPVDVESNLMGINGNQDYTLQSQCDNEDDQYACVFGAGGNKRNMDTCFLPTEDTRLSNPASNLRGSGINRFDPLCLNPQKGVIPQAQYNIPTRLVVKENFVPCVPTPAMNTMLPVQQPLPSIPTMMGVQGAYTRPLYQYDVCG